MPNAIPPAPRNRPRPLAHNAPARARRAPSITYRLGTVKGRTGARSRSPCQAGTSAPPGA